MLAKNLIELFKDITDDTQDIEKLGYEISTATEVPNDEDSGLTFESGKVKKAKEITTCILYIDIRDSTNLSNKHKKPEKMGKLYSSFVNAMADIAIYYGASVRNIIGDRVMIVFPVKDCFTKAVDCAIACNQACHNIIDKELAFDSFKFGIGIDYGKMTVIKVGLPMQGKERSPYKGLVWIGEPANIASKLTDVANKTVENQEVELRLYTPPNPFANDKRGFIGRKITENYTPPTSISIEEFVNDTSLDNEGKMLYKGRRVLSYKMTKSEIKYPPILMTQRVFDEFKKLNPQRKSIKENLWHKQPNISKYDGNIYGGNVIWEL